MELAIPKLGMSMVEGELLEWLVPDGSRVSVGQDIYLIATDKVEVAVEAPADGVLRQSAETGTTYEVGTKVGSIDED